MALLNWKVKRSLTKSDIVQICVELSKLFSMEFKTEYKFRPLCRVEGGIECYVWPGRGTHEYKQIRFSDFCGPWPRTVPNNWQEEWTGEAEKDTVIVKQTICDIFNRGTNKQNIAFNTHTEWKRGEKSLLKKYMQYASVI